jgi:hypothetical protein
VNSPVFAVAGVAAAVFLARLLHIILGGLTYEDAYISLRYAANLAAGRGLVYNPGEAVFGATTPLYVLLLALFTGLGAPAPLVWGKLLGAAADALTAALWFGALRRETGAALPGIAFAVFFGLSPFVVEVSVSGMETPLVLLGLTAAFLATHSGRTWLTGALLGALALLRLDTLPAALILLIALALRTRRLPWREAALAAALFLPWALFATAVYGSPVPNSIPAKIAAYQAHQSAIWPNLNYTLSFLAPYRNGWREELFNAAVLPLFLLGLLGIARRDRDWWPLPALFLAHFSFLVLSRTVLFRWYFPAALLPYYVVAALGVAELSKRVGERLPAVVTLLLGLHACYWLWGNIERARRLQEVEGRTRVAIGQWLAANTPADAVVAMEPIGYIGYTSGRRVLDEVGLVSPEMIPINRGGDGWFGRMLREFAPDYVVERPYFLAHNSTVNRLHIRMFAEPQDRRWFEAHYEGVAFFRPSVAPFATKAYHFTIFRRKSAKSSIRRSNR